jgi:DNA-binding NarL/FixJ family response regulator
VWPSLLRHDSGVAVSVVVVDDDPGFQRAAAAVLSAQGLVVVACAGDGREAVAAVQRLKPEGVLLDVWLQAEDGFQVACRLCALDPAPAVLLTSSDPTAVSPSRVRACGAVGFVPKVDLVQTDLNAYFNSGVDPAE